MSKKLSLNIALSQCYFLSTNEKNILAKTVDTLDDLLVLSIYDISKILDRAVTYKNWNPEKLAKAVDNDLRLMNLYKINMTVNTENQFPRLLKQIPEPPFAIYWRGKFPSDKTTKVAMVGTRRPTGLGITTAKRLATEFAENNVCVVSGLALGVDTFSHQGVVSKQGNTIAVLACGLETIYPKTNSKLAGRILETGGCIISEYAPGEPAMQYRFPERNRIISGLSKAVLVVEAPKNSGALITAEFAKKQGKPVFVCKRLLESIQNQGSVIMYNNGTSAIDSATELLSDSMLNKNLVMQKKLFGEE